MIIKILTDKGSVYTVFISYAQMEAEMCYVTCLETSVHLVLVKIGHHSELAGLEAPHPCILPGQLPELTHSISCYGAGTVDTSGTPRA